MPRKDHYAEYLSTIHAKFTTPDEIIRDVAREATHDDIYSKKRIIAGEGNEVYEIGLLNHTEVIVRVSRYEDKDFEQEKWAIGECQKLGIPVPEMLLVKHLFKDGKRLDICVQRKIEGDLLERGVIDLHSMPEAEMKSIIAQAGELLSKIHSIKTKGFGYLNVEGEGPFKTFSEFIKEELSKEFKYLDLAEKVGFDMETMKRTLEILRIQSSLGENISPILSHNDFGPKHIMVKGGKISGILDFGEVQGNLPVNDFAKWDYWYGDYIPTDWLKEGYSDKSIFNENFKELMQLIKLRTGLGVLSWYEARNYPKGVEDAKQKLTQELKYFD